MSDLEPQQSIPPVQATRPGWYPVDGELRWWDGGQWTVHRQPLAQPPMPTQQTYTPYHPGTTLIRDTRSNPVEVTFAWIFAVCTLGYMLPWAVAATRGKSNSWAIALVNFLLGWTFLGWLAALVMACMAHQVVAVRQ